MIVTIDGPAGAGKSSIARRAAERLAFEFLDTGALYRAATLSVLRRDCDLAKPDDWLGQFQQTAIRPDGDRVWLDEEDVSDQIRSPEVTAGIVHLADVTAVRRKLSDVQRAYARGRDIVTEGRDQGTEVFPHAECKIFLTASPEARAKRRYDQWTLQGRSCSLEGIRQAQDKRDAEDAARPIGRLRPADDAALLQTDDLSPDEVLDRVLTIVQRHRT